MLHLNKNICFQFMRCMLLLLPSAFNLAYTHYRVCDLGGLYITPIVAVNSLISICFDVLLLALIVLIISKKRILFTAVSVFIITLLWGMSNIVYATYFQNYIPLSSFAYASSLLDLQITEYIANALRLSDAFYLIIVGAAILMFYGLRHIRKIDGSLRYIAIPLVVITMFLLSWKLFVYNYHFTIPNRTTLSQVSLMPTKARLTSDNIKVTTEFGFFRACIFPKLFMDNGTITLSVEQRKMIESNISYRDKEYSDTTLHRSPKQYKEVILILAESYLAGTSGAHITPFLDSLRRDSTVLVNDRMHPNVQMGKSSDGQYIYMTGLLPSQNDITLSILPHSHVVSLAHILKHHGFTTMITLPTGPTIWNQNIANESYGIDRSFSISDLRQKEWLNDEQLIDFALDNERKCKGPLFHVILTVSTHGPYTDDTNKFMHCKCYPKHFPKTYSQEYKNYLLACHFMDHQLRRYVEAKDSENTLIIIASDHGWQEDKKLLPKGVSPNDISLFIMNAKGQHDYRRERIDQLDVFTTIIDLLQPYNSKTTLPHWYGLGRSILRPEHWRPSVTPKTWQMSQDILEGDYFKNVFEKK